MYYNSVDYEKLLDKRAKYYYSKNDSCQKRYFGKMIYAENEYLIGKIMMERFGKDSLIVLATVVD